MLTELEVIAAVRLEKAVESREYHMGLLVKAIEERQDFEKSGDSPVNISANMGYTDGVKFVELRESVLTLAKLTANVDKALLAACARFDDDDLVYDIDAWQELEGSNAEKEEVPDEEAPDTGDDKREWVRGTWGRGKWVKF